MTQLNDMTAAYIECIDFTDSEALESAESFSEQAKASARDSCAEFLRHYSESAPQFDAAQLGHDLWLTRNGHGVGFWDRPEIYGATLADEYSRYSEFVGAQDAYTGDDNLIYIA